MLPNLSAKQLILKSQHDHFDSSGIEAWVTENNPKFANRIIKQLKAYAKANHFDSNFDPYKAAYGSMPAHCASNVQIKQLYVDGHFCYAYKIGIVTNGLGIVRHLEFYNKDFYWPILNLFQTRNLILLMKINPFMMQGSSFQCCRTSSRRIL